MTDIFPIIATVMSFGAFLVSAANYVRNGDWRNTDEGRSVMARITQAEERLAKVEIKVDDLATKGDISTLRAEFHGLEKVVTKEIESINRSALATEAAIVRVEQFLMESGSRVKS